MIIIWSLIQGIDRYLATTIARSIGLSKTVIVSIVARNIVFASDDHWCITQRQKVREIIVHLIVVSSCITIIETLISSEYDQNMICLNSTIMPHASVNIGCEHKMLKQAFRKLQNNAYTYSTVDKTFGAWWSCISDLRDIPIRLKFEKSFVHSTLYSILYSMHLHSVVML